MDAIGASSAAQHSVAEIALFSTIACFDEYKTSTLFDKIYIIEMYCNIL